MHEGKCLSQLDKGKFALLEMLYNDDKWRHGECFWSTLSDCTSSYIVVIMFSFLFPDSNRPYYGQHKSFTFFFFFFKHLWYCLAHSVENSSWALLLIPSWISVLQLTGLKKHAQGMVTILPTWREKKKKDSMFPVTKYTNTTLNTTAMCSLLSLPYCYLWHKESTGHCCAVYQCEQILCK